MHGVVLYCPLFLYMICVYGCFLKWWHPTTMGFLTKNDHFGVFWGYHHLRKHPYRYLVFPHSRRSWLVLQKSFWRCCFHSPMNSGGESGANEKQG